MATLDDLREAGYDVELAWAGYRDAQDRFASPDVYVVSREGALPSSARGRVDGGLSAYLPDDPDVLEDFLSHEDEPEYPGQAEAEPGRALDPPGVPVEVRSENLSGDK